MSNSHFSYFNYSLRSNYVQKKQKGSDTPPFYSITANFLKSFLINSPNLMLGKVFFDNSEEFV